MNRLVEVYQKIATLIFAVVLIVATVLLLTGCGPNTEAHIDKYMSGTIIPPLTPREANIFQDMAMCEASRVSEELTREEWEQGLFYYSCHQAPLSDHWSDLLVGLAEAQ